MNPPRPSIDAHPPQIHSDEYEHGWLARLAGRLFGRRRQAPLPADLADQVTVLGIQNARFWADSQGGALAHEAQLALEREKAAAGRTEGAHLLPAHFLAISGGSDDGAFGAGLLCGWSDAGTMPTFKLVTGVSTGAMIAPFAFLGRSYMDGLRAVYTTIGPRNVLKKLGIQNAVFGEALADTAPLYGLITHYVNQQMLADVASEYRRGRLLLIGTASLDAQRPVIWNVGAIAASGLPDTLELIRKVILASAAIPGAFPPVMIEVEAEGHHYQEMNVDGGVVAQSFLYPADLGLRVDFAPAELARERHAYIIRNSRLDPEWASVNRRFLNISGRAIATMIHYIGYNDLLRIYATAKRDGVDYNLAYIEPDFPHVKHEKFDREYMKALFDSAYAKGRHGFAWRKAPPILDLATPSDQPR
jgi:predicted patatin/cPLA2 family phospholipase